MTDEEMYGMADVELEGDVDLSRAAARRPSDPVLELCDRGDCGHRVCKIRGIASALSYLADELAKVEGETSLGEYLALDVPASSLRYWSAKLNCYADAGGRFVAGNQLAEDRGIDKLDRGS